MVATAKYGGEAISELNRLLDDETNIDYREYLQKRIDDLKAQQKNKSIEELSPAVHKSTLNKKTIKKLATTVLIPQEIEDLEEYLIDIYGLKLATEYVGRAFSCSSGHVSVSGLPNISISVSFSILDNFIGLWEITGSFIVHKSDQMISEYSSNLNAMGSYTEIESISNISSKITGITSLLGQSVSWQETATSSELHGRHADVTIEGAFTKTNPLWGTTDPIYSGYSVSVNYITKEEHENYN